MRACSATTCTAAGDGIVKSGIEHTIETVGALAHTGMADTDRQIIRLMMEP